MTPSVSCKTRLCALLSLFGGLLALASPTYAGAPPFPIVQISSVADFNAIRANPQSGVVYRLTRDIDFRGKTLNPIYLYNAYFDGQNHVLRNFVIVRNIQDGEFNATVGVFENVYNSTVYAVGIENFSIVVNNAPNDPSSRLYNAGPLVGYLYQGYVAGCWAHGGTLATNLPIWYEGGLVGSSCNSEINRSWSDATISITLAPHDGNPNIDGLEMELGGLAGGCGNGLSLQTVTNSYSTTTWSFQHQAPRTLPIFGTSGGGASFELNDRTYDSRSLAQSGLPDTSGWDFTSVWQVANPPLLQPVSGIRTAAKWKMAGASTVANFDQCVRVDLSAADIFDQPVAPRAGIPVTFKAGELQAYATADNCAANQSPLSGLTFPSSAPVVSFYVRSTLTGPAPWNSYTVHLVALTDQVRSGFLYLQIN